MQRDGGLAGARAALHDQRPRWSERMIRSCSTWIVSTMSRICPVRFAFIAASSACLVRDRSVVHVVADGVEIQRLVVRCRPPRDGGSGYAAGGVTPSGEATVAR